MLSSWKNNIITAVNIIVADASLVLPLSSLEIVVALKKTSVELQQYEFLGEILTCSLRADHKLRENKEPKKLATTMETVQMEGEETSLDAAF